MLHYSKYYNYAGVQYGMYDGKCGICGDPYGDYPRQHESPGGIFATGIIVKTYKQVRSILLMSTVSYLILIIVNQFHDSIGRHHA